MAAHNLNNELKRHYRRNLEIGFICGLILVFGFLHASPDFENIGFDESFSIAKIDVGDIPRTAQLRIPPPPPPPFVPLPPEEIVQPMDEPILPLRLDLTAVPPPPLLEPDRFEQEFTFVPYEVPPQPVAGYAAIKKRIQYPPRALDLKLEGIVILGILVDESGESAKIMVLKPAKQQVGFEAAAIRAVSGVKWRPARQRDKPVSVWVAIPVRFQVRSQT